MSELPVGISDLCLYVPRPEIDIATIIEMRGKGKPELIKRLARACETTGQKKMRFPEVWEDTTTLAAQAALGLFRQNPALDPAKLRYLTVGTETSVDHSKPVSAYVEGLLQKSGVPIPKNISTFQVQHACAGGALGAISVGALLSFSNRPGESGLVICSDIARYETASTAEITQGAGASALIVENNPKLVELDLSNMGFASEDVDDFFRPLGSVAAKVRGTFSIQCYNSSLEAAFADHCERRGESARAILESTDYFVLHVPFRNLAARAMAKLVAGHLGLGKEQAEAFLCAKSFQLGVDPIADIGNTYTASIFMSLAFLLDGQYKQIGNRIQGKRILLASYGSGNTMAVVSARVAERAPEILKRWDIASVWREASARSFAEYESWLAHAGGRDPEGDGRAAPGSFYLSGIREDGYREYALR